MFKFLIVRKLELSSLCFTTKRINTDYIEKTKLIMHFKLFSVYYMLGL